MRSFRWQDEGITVATYGDMLKVPGSGTSLLEERSMGMDVRIVTSADQALSLAKAHRDRTIVLIAVGFETTAPATASVILDARAEGLENFLVLDFTNLCRQPLKPWLRIPLSDWMPCCCRVMSA